MIDLNKNIKLENDTAVNSKASEEYVKVQFTYTKQKSWSGWVPIEYRRTGVSIKKDNINELYPYLNSIYEKLNPRNYSGWLSRQDEYWSNTKSVETNKIFNILRDGKWHCRNCDIQNPNFARRIQELKEIGEERK